MRHTKRLFLSLHNPDNFLYDFQSPIQQQPQKTAAATEQIQATDTNISTRQQLLQHPQKLVKTVKIIAVLYPPRYALDSLTRGQLSKQKLISDICFNYSPPIWVNYDLRRILSSYILLQVKEA